MKNSLGLALLGLLVLELFNFLGLFLVIKYALEVIILEIKKVRFSELLSHLGIGILSFVVERNFALLVQDRAKGEIQDNLQVHSNVCSSESTSCVFDKYFCMNNSQLDCIFQYYSSIFKYWVKYCINSSEMPLRCKFP